MHESIYEGMRRKEAGDMDVSISTFENRKLAATLLHAGFGVCIDETSPEYGGYARINDAKSDGTVSISFYPRTASRKHAADFEPVAMHDLPEYFLDCFYG